MMLGVALLSVLIGVSLGLLGGGGSILTVPVLLYVGNVPPSVAIAMSLLVVGLTSAAGMVEHARAGRVQWGTGLRFGVAAMAGAFAGGKVSHRLPPSLLITGFALMMLVTAVAMMRGRKELGAEAGVAPSWVKSSLLGASVGLVAGLLGAGGGFLIVPALVLFGGVPMKSAIGTSLLVLTLQSLAGFAGHVGATPLPWGLTAIVTVAAVGGSFIGGRLSGKLSQAALRQGFAWFVVVMAVFMLARQLPDAARDSALFHAVFVARWPWYVAGPAIAAVVMLMLAWDNKPLGVSTGYAELCQVRSNAKLLGSWRLPFIAGIVLGGLVAGMLGGEHVTFSLGAFDQLVSAAPWIKVPVLLGAGVLIGYGSRVAGGCTSGHSIVGTALGSRASLVATVLFMIGGFAATQALVLARGWLG